MRKYKISWVKKNKYAVISYTEAEDEMFIEAIFKGNISECEAFVKDRRNAETLS